MAALAALPQFSETNPLTLSWSGTDDISGVSRYTLWYRMDEAPQAVLADLDAPTTSLDLWVGDDTQYWFSVQAADRAGNVAPKSVAGRQSPRECGSRPAQWMRCPATGGVLPLRCRWR